MNKNKKSGFIALFSMIIISFILLIVAIDLNYSNLLIHFNISDSESKKISESLALSCLESARLSLAFDKNLSGDNFSMNIEGNLCYYSISNTPIFYIKEIIAHSSYKKARTYYQINVDINTPGISIISFVETPNINTN
jgi:hypothetical protein